MSKTELFLYKSMCSNDTRFELLNSYQLESIVNSD